jgi:hypothetical protein
MAKLWYCLQNNIGYDENRAWSIPDDPPASQAA